MKRIYFMRHAKAAKENRGCEGDFDRELSSRGKDDVLLMIKRLKQLGVCFDAIFSSPAKRAKETAKKIASGLEFGGKIRFVDEFYECEYETILSFLKKLDNGLESVLVVGHNPSLLNLCEFLSDSVLESMPTCAVFGVEFGFSYADLSENSANLLLFEYPKKLRGKL